jgi:uncharacterized protein
VTTSPAASTREPSAPATSDPHPLFELRTSPIQGVGAFALTKIRKGTRIIEYIGEIITDEEADRRYDDESQERHHTFLFALDNGFCIDAAFGGNDARFINHSCDPNCEAMDVKGKIWIEAIRTIQPGEELAYDYAYERDGEHDAEWEKLYVCHCGAANCRGTILAPKKEPKPVASKRKKKTKTAKKTKKTSPKKKTSSTRSKTTSRTTSRTKRKTGAKQSKRRSTRRSTRSRR